MRKTAALAWTFFFALGSVNALAQTMDNDHDGDHDHDCPSGHCEVKTRKDCFNVVCSFEGKDWKGEERKCTAASTFKKEVTWSGGEVQDDSDMRDQPTLEVSCEGEDPFFNNSANRYTDLLGTRIQGLTGPNPAIILPRGALHSGANGTSGFHTVRAKLEIDLDGRRDNGLSGRCSIWTGQP